VIFLRRASSVAVALLAAALIAASPSIVVTGQLLAYQDGFVFFTTGDGFRIAPDVAIRNAAGNGPATIAPGPRVWARAHFDPNGTVTELDLSRAALPKEGNFDDVARFAVALSSPLPNPDLLPATPAPGATGVAATEHFSGRPVLVTFNVQVPPNTPFGASVYISTDASGWNAQAIPMDRTDALHYQITRRFNSGTIFRYLYDRGSFQSEEVAQNGLQREPRGVVITDADVRVVRDTIYAWVDALSGSNGQQPSGLPTPYNPAPFPNLPGGFPSPGVPPPHPPKPPQAAR
jgi:hypothetical protein